MGATASLVCERAERYAFSGAVPTKLYSLYMLSERLSLLDTPGTTRCVPINASVP